MSREVHKANQALTLGKHSLLTFLDPFSARMSVLTGAAMVIDKTMFKKTKQIDDEPFAGAIYASYEYAQNLALTELLQKTITWVLNSCSVQEAGR